MRTALLAGASGLVGGELLPQLLAHEAWDRVTILVRRELKIAHPKLEQRPTDFDALGTIPWFPRCDDIFCCLGTTRAKAGSAAAFRKVDFHYVVELAKRAALLGAEQFLVVSSLGANARSPSLYSRVKGEAEQALKPLQFSGTHIFRPSFLSGRRAESRPGERLALGALSFLSFALYGPLYRLRPVPADVVARAMVRVAVRGAPGFNVHLSDEIQRLGEAQALS